jgi:hypothetical protein
MPPATRSPHMRIRARILLQSDKTSSDARWILGFQLTEAHARTAQELHKRYDDCRGRAWLDTEIITLSSGSSSGRRASEMLSAGRRWLQNAVSVGLKIVGATVRVRLPPSAPPEKTRMGTKMILCWFWSELHKRCTSLSESHNRLCGVLLFTLGAVLLSDEVACASAAKSLVQADIAGRTSR